MAEQVLVFLRENFAYPSKECETQECVDPLQLVTFSFFLHWALFGLSALLSPFIFSSFKELASFRRPEWHARVVSTIHAIFSSYGAFFSLLTVNTAEGTYYNENLYYREWYILFSLGYFLYDLMVIHIFPKTMWDLPTFIHHSLGLSAIFLVFGRSQCEYYFSGFLFTEITTPFINQRWFFYNSRMGDSVWYKINGLIVIVLWFVVRIVFTGFLAYNAVYVEVFLLDGIMRFFCPFILLSAVLLNLTWFRLIILASLRAFAPKKK
eukprot:TRINITY_DN5461_c0_g1_i1.p1 TRINITY_DN5461_c0_g1~~TRINITY_DN5461_c0_g1_i1.p1  ORF type:complete len:265 (+),score=107.08 TRINITY_DN5461_c0_g1_i1:81-875(+)